MIRSQPLRVKRGGPGTLWVPPGSRGRGARAQELSVEVRVLPPIGGGAISLHESEIDNTNNGAYPGNTNGISDLSYEDNAIAGALIPFVVFAEDADVVSSVTFGAAPMTVIATAAAVTGGEPCRSYLFFQGSGFDTPGGTRNLSISLSTSEYTYLWGGWSFLSATGLSEVVDSDILESASLADPSITLDSGSVSAMGYAVLASGVTNEGDVTAGTGCTKFDGIDDNALGGGAGGTNSGHVLGRTTNPETGSRALAFSALADEVAMCAALIAEAPIPTQVPVRGAVGL